MRLLVLHLEVDSQPYLLRLEEGFSRNLRILVRIWLEKLSPIFQKMIREMLLLSPTWLATMWAIARDAAQTCSRLLATTW